MWDQVTSKDPELLKSFLLPQAMVQNNRVIQKSVRTVTVGRRENTGVRKESQLGSFVVVICYNLQKSRVFTHSCRSP